jgi:lysophospholipase L1-like esterase
MNVLAMQDLAVSLYLPDADVQVSQHTGAMTTSYAASGGDHAALDGGEPFKVTFTTMPLLKAIDVSSKATPGAIVAFGDSITDGTCSTLDAHDRWQDWLAVRLALTAVKPGAHKAVVNEGIGGNTLTSEGLQPPPDSTPGLERFERDVMSHQGVTDVILFMGTNDIRRGASAAQVIDAMTRMAAAVKSRRMKVFAATIIPRHNVPPAGTNTGWDDAKTAIRREVNQWMRTHAKLDGVLDFDAAVRDPANADLIFSPYNCDGIHPTSRGYFEMGKLLPLNMFTR